MFVDEQYKSTIYSICVFLDSVIPRKRDIPEDVVGDQYEIHIAPYGEYPFRWSYTAVLSAHVQGGQKLVIFST